MHIVLVEDSLVDAQLLRLCLRQVLPEATLNHFGTFAEASDFWERESPRLVMLDWSLPDMTGPQALAQLEKALPGVPVVVLVRAGEQKIGRRAIELGARDFLAKGDFGLETFERVMRHIAHTIALEEKNALESQKAIFSDNLFRETLRRTGTRMWKLELLGHRLENLEGLSELLGTAQEEGPDDLSGLLQRIHPDDRERFAATIARAGGSGSPEELFHRLIGPGHDEKPCFSFVVPGEDPGSGKMCLYGFTQDHSRYLTPEYLWMARRMLQSSTKLRRELISDMSFRLRTPLGTLVNLLFLFDKTPMDEEQSVLYEALSSSAFELTSAASSLLNLSLLDNEQIPQHKAPFVLLDCVRSAWKAQSTKLNRRTIAFREHFDRSLPEKMTGDSQQLFQILYNLFDHSLHLLPEKRGFISLRIDVLQRTVRETKLSFEISDSGGYHLDEETISRWLSSEIQSVSAVTEDKLRQLNVPMANVLAQAMGGELTIEKDTDHRPTYRLVLDFGTVEQKTAPHPPLPEKWSSLRILLVEDHPLNQIAAKKVLLSWGEDVSVEIAENGRAALDKIDEQTFDVVLMDLQMPEMDGMEAFVAIRRFSAVPIVAVTANASPQEESRCLEAGFNAYLSKPYRPQALYETISSVLKA